jgi:hypothetical protein
LPPCLPPCRIRLKEAEAVLQSAKGGKKGLPAHQQALYLSKENVELLNNWFRGPQEDLPWDKTQIKVRRSPKDVEPSLTLVQAKLVMLGDVMENKTKKESFMRGEQPAIVTFVEADADKYHLLLKFVKAYEEDSLADFGRVVMKGKGKGEVRLETIATIACRIVLP